MCSNGAYLAAIVHASGRGWAVICVEIRVDEVFYRG